MSGRQRLPTSRRFVPLAAAAAVSIATAAAYVRLKLLREGLDPSDASSADLVSYYYPMLRWGFAELAGGRLPLWNPHQSAGTPFLAIPNVGFFYPFYVPFLLLPAAAAQTLDIVLHLTIAGLAMFACCRHMGMTAGASLLGAVVYACHGGMATKLYFPNFLAPTAWMPLLFPLFDRVLAARSTRAAAALAAVVALMLLAGNLQFVYFAALALVPFGAVRAAAMLGREGGRVAARAVILLFAAGCGAVLLASVRLMPAAEYMRETWRPPGVLSMAHAGIMAIPPRFLVTNLLSPLPGPDLARQTYGGVLPLVLAGVGVALWRPRAVALAMAVTGLGAALYALGPHGPVFPLLFRLPAGGWFRGPNRIVAVLGLAVAFLGAAGLDVLCRRGTLGRDRAAALTALAVTAATVLGATWLLDVPGARLVALHCGAALLAGTLLLLAERRAALRHTVVAAVLLITAADLFGGQRPQGALPARLDSYLARYESFFADVRARQGFYRTHVAADFPSRWLRFHSDLAKAGLNHGVWMTTDYEPLCDRRQDRWIRFLGNLPEVPFSVCYRVLPLTSATQPFLRLAGVRFYLVADRENPPSPEVLAGWRPLRHADGVSLYEDPNALPRAFVVGRVEVEPDAERVLERMRSVDLATTALVEEPLPEPLAASDAREPGRATIVRYEPNRVAVRTASDAGGLLVLTDRWFRGWRVTVDGRPGTILRTDYLYRGVVVPAGEHVVEFVYQPRSFVLGALGSALGVLGVGLLAWGPWRLRSSAARVRHQGGTIASRATERASV
jgi:hypothetical protein